jgi:hypothetical protein
MKYSVLYWENVKQKLMGILSMLRGMLEDSRTQSVLRDKLVQ